MSISKFCVREDLNFLVRSALLLFNLINENEDVRRGGEEGLAGK